MTKVAPCGQTDGRTGRYEGVNSLFRDFANAPETLTT
jgi:hypothetical protein